MKKKDWQESNLTQKYFLAKGIQVCLNAGQLTHLFQGEVIDITLLNLVFLLGSVVQVSDVVHGPILPFCSVSIVMSVCQSASVDPYHTCLVAAIFNLNTV